jgi:hypothetical protein
MDHPIVLDTVINIWIRGGKSLRIPITAQIVVPNIEVIEPELDFGQLTLGASSSLPVTMKNSSWVEGTLYVNMAPYPEFVLSDWGDQGSSLESISASQYRD